MPQALLWVEPFGLTQPENSGHTEGMGYHRTQKGFLTIPTAVLFGVVAVAMLKDSGGTSATPVVTSVVFMAAVLAIVLMFSYLRVTVDNGEVVAAFGFGRPRRVIKLAEIADARQVRNRWFNGWGIRKVRRGWMFNVWGLDAVELELSSGKVFRIGTDDPEGLLRALSR